MGEILSRGAVIYLVGHVPTGATEPTNPGPEAPEEPVCETLLRHDADLRSRLAAAEERCKVLLRERDDAKFVAEETQKEAEQLVKSAEERAKVAEERLAELEKALKGIGGSAWRAVAGESDAALAPKEGA